MNLDSTASCAPVSPTLKLSSPSWRDFNENAPVLCPTTRTLYPDPHSRCETNGMKKGIEEVSIVRRIPISHQMLSCGTVNGFETSMALGVFPQSEFSSLAHHSLFASHLMWMTSSRGVHFVLIPMRLQGSLPPNRTFADELTVGHFMLNDLLKSRRLRASFAAANMAESLTCLHTFAVTGSGVVIQSVTASILRIAWNELGGWRTMIASLREALKL